MATNQKIHFLVGTNRNNLPTLSASTVGNIYFLIENDYGTGKIIMDTTTDTGLARVTMSTESIYDGMANTIASTYISNIAFASQTNATTGAEEVKMSVTKGDGGITNTTIDLSAATPNLLRFI